MKKYLLFSLVTMVYLTLFRLTGFETCDIGSATILLEIGVPLFALLAVVLLAIGLYRMIRPKTTHDSYAFLTVVINFISLCILFIK